MLNTNADSLTFRFVIDGARVPLDRHIAMYLSGFPKNQRPQSTRALVRAGFAVQFKGLNGYMQHYASVLQARALAPSRSVARSEQQYKAIIYLTNDDEELSNLLIVNGRGAQEILRACLRVGFTLFREACQQIITPPVQAETSLTPVQPKATASQVQSLSDASSEVQAVSMVEDDSSDIDDPEAMLAALLEELADVP